MSDDSAIEREIQAKGLTAPRVMPQNVQDAITSVCFFRGSDAFAGRPHPPELDLLTFCVLVLRNGFTVTGQSACASPENFDAEIGMKVARADAESKVWPLLGYALRTRLKEVDEREAANAARLAARVDGGAA